MNLYYIDDMGQELLIWAKDLQAALSQWREYFDLMAEDEPEKSFLVPTEVPAKAKALAWHRDVKLISEQGEA